MREIIQGRWKVDNTERFERKLFEQRRFLLGKYSETDINFGRYPRKTGERTNPYVKLKVVEGRYIIKIKAAEFINGIEKVRECSLDFADEAAAGTYLRSAGYVMSEQFKKNVRLYRMKNEKYTKAFIHEMKWGTYLKVIGSVPDVMRIGRKMGFNDEDLETEVYADAYRKYLITKGLIPGILI